MDTPWKSNFDLSDGGSWLKSRKLSAAALAVAEGDVTDLLVLSHGWNNDMADARGLYSRIAGSMRSVLGANGISLEHPIFRHMVNLESVSTYEGTHEIHTLVVGADITGHSAYAG